MDLEKHFFQILYNKSYKKSNPITIHELLINLFPNEISDNQKEDINSLIQHHKESRHIRIIGKWENTFDSSQTEFSKICITPAGNKYYLDEFYNDSIKHPGLYKWKKRLIVILLIISSIVAFLANWNQIIPKEPSDTNQLDTTTKNRHEPEQKISIIPISDTDIYASITIGTQVWMSHNLDADTFQNGRTIYQAKDRKEWVECGKNKIPCWCYYNNNTDTKDFGKLYNWWVVNDTLELAPKGWRIPNYQDWITLLKYCKGLGRSGFILKSTEGWESNGKGNNVLEFNGQPGGWRTGLGTFSSPGRFGDWWSSTEANKDSAWNCLLKSNSDTADLNYYSKKSGFSIRLIKTAQ